MATGTIKQTDIGYQDYTSKNKYKITYSDESKVTNCADQSGQTRIIRQGNLYYIYLMVSFTAKNIDPTSHWVGVLQNEELSGLTGRFVVYNSTTYGAVAIRISGDILVAHPGGVNVGDIIYGSACLLK